MIFIFEFTKEILDFQNFKYFLFKLDLINTFKKI